jgi:dTDP-4-amino-4,6-dideoxygalactose transaminase
MTNGEFIPFYAPSFDREEIDEVSATLRSGSWNSGEKTARLETEFRKVVNSQHALAVNSPSAALHLALAGLGIGPGDEVITSPLTFCGTVNSILHVGARPVLADVGADGNIDPESIVKRITKRTRAIVPVHASGASSDMNAIWELARRRRIRVVEDATYGPGGFFQDQPTGSSAPSFASDAVAFGFHATENNVSADSGMVVTPSDDLAARMRILANHGISKDAVLGSGFHYKITDLQASVEIHQLRKMAAFQAQREAVAKRYHAAFSVLDEIEVPPASAHGKHAWHLYTIRLRFERLNIDRDEFMRQLRARGIGSSVHFVPVQVHRFFTPYAAENFCPRAMELYPRLVSVPNYPGLGEDRAKRVIDAVTEIVGAHRTTARAYLRAMAMAR